jgi:membrane protease YdiL (CAAX protease family)
MLPEKPWRAEAVILFCAAQFACLCLGLAAAGLLHRFGVGGFKQPGDFGNVLLVTASFQGVTWILIPVFLRQHEIGLREAFGFRGPELKRSLFLAVVLMAFVIAPAAWWWQEISAFVLKSFGWAVEDQAAVTLLTGAKFWLTRIYLVVFAVVLAPVAEEFIFRGVLFPFVKQLGCPRLAWFGVSALFALIHFDAAIFASLFVLALALTWLYEKTGNLLAPIAAHALFNAANLFVFCLWQNNSGG